ncbi:VapE domain-containing protein [Methylobacterium oryzisoli]|uniref:VapE domain-containing protein n=1 Tax=Methylobacterium oryzisoli TaxID=3385502 RepID=UPI003891E5F3
MFDGVYSVAASARGQSHSAAQLAPSIAQAVAAQPAFSQVGTYGTGVRAFVEGILEQREITFQFNGSPRSLKGQWTATCLDEVLACLSFQPISLSNLPGDLVLAARDLGLKVGADILRHVVRTLQEEAKTRRRAAVLHPLMQPLTSDEQIRAEQMWRDLVAAAFDMPADLAIALLKHFIHQVKSKPLYREIHHHMMPIIVSPHQDAGKTTFVRRLVQPLDDLVSGAALLSDLSDKRCQKLLSYPVFVIDDCEQIKGQQIPILKALLTAEEVERRNLGTSFTETVSQLATMIATANQPVSELIKDPSGHHRFPQMTFRIDPNSPDHAAAWEVINATNFHLLWRSVDVFEPSPVLHHLPAQRELQAEHT